MLFGVLKMPYEMAMESELSRLQFYQRVQQLVARFEAQPPLPQRTWVGLTVEDITKIDQGIYPTWRDEVQAIEARLKELNNG